MDLDVRYAALIVLVALVPVTLFALSRNNFNPVVLSMVSVAIIFGSVALMFGFGEEMDLPGRA